MSFLAPRLSPLALFILSSLLYLFACAGVVYGVACRMLAFRPFAAVLCPGFGQVGDGVQRLLHDLAIVLELGLVGVRRNADWPACHTGGPGSGARDCKTI